MQTRAILTTIILAFSIASCGGVDESTSAAPGDKYEGAAQEAATGSETDSDGDGVNDLYDSSPNDAMPEEPTREEANADGEYDLKCDYELGDFGDSGDPAQGFRFIAGGTLNNIGNVGIRVRVTYSWKLLGRDAKTIRKHYRLRQGQTRDVNLTVPVSSDDVDAHQSADGDCTAKATIVESFGEPPFQ